MADEEKTDEKTEHEQEMEKAKEEVQQLEDDPPEKLEDWPDGKAKYETYGGPDSESAYDEGPTTKLGPSDLEYQEDGSIEIKGEKVDNPEDYKGDPIPGGPTDPNAT